MRLSAFNKYHDIVIQCHDNPDPDSIAAGFGLYRYFTAHHKKVRLIYSGRLQITKPNILMFVKALEIPLEYVEVIEPPELLITVDCQYGAGNVRKLEAHHVAIIDHHQQEVSQGENIFCMDIRNFLSSASTIVWDLLVKEGYQLQEEAELQTALYYGLFTDSSGFSEINYPLDKDMRDSLQFDKGLIRQLKNSVLSLRELEIAGMALIRHSYNVVNKFVIVRAQECDPNILGFISDLALQVDSVNVCIVYNQMEDGIKYSVRSCIKEVRANELASYLALGLGTGGGHVDKAGGFLKQRYFNEAHEHINADEYFLTRLTAYYESFEVIDTVEEEVDTSGMKCYKQLPVYVGAISLTEIFKPHTLIMIRSLQGDIACRVEEGDYLIIDYKGRVHLMDKEIFDATCTMKEESYNLALDYFPSIRNRLTDEVITLEKRMKKCLLKGTHYIYARQLEKDVKLFGLWNREDYMYGKKGDYIVVSQRNLQDAYIVEAEFFNRGYEEK